MGLFITGLLLSIFPTFLSRIPKARLVSIFLLLPLLLDAILGGLFSGWGSNSISSTTGFLAGMGVTLAVYSAITGGKNGG